MNSVELEAVMNRVIRDGEIPYQANRRVIQAFDIFRDPDEGLQHLLVMLEGIDVLTSELEAFENVAEKISRHARTTLR